MHFDANGLPVSDDDDSDEWKEQVRKYREEGPVGFLFHFVDGTAMLMTFAEAKAYLERERYRLWDERLTEVFGSTQPRIPEYRDE